MKRRSRLLAIVILPFWYAMLFCSTARYSDLGYGNPAVGGYYWSTNVTANVLLRLVFLPPAMLVEFLSGRTDHNKIVFIQDPDALGLRFGHRISRSATMLTGVNLDIILVVLTVALVACLVHDRVAKSGRDPSLAPQCAKCGYSLVGLQSARCPECGTHFRDVPQSTCKR